MYGYAAIRMTDKGKNFEMNNEYAPKSTLLQETKNSDN